LLQGFNITSADSLNNIITILNKKFNYSYKANFVDNDYQFLLASYSSDEASFEANDVFKSIYFEILSEYSNGKGEKTKYNLNECFEKITKHLDDNYLPYSLEDRSEATYDAYKALLTMGIKIKYSFSNEIMLTDSRKSNPSKITFLISPFNFKSAFEIYLGLMKSFYGKEWAWLDFRLNDIYQYITREEALSSITAQHREIYSPNKNGIGNYKYLATKFNFGIRDEGKWKAHKELDYVLCMSFRPEETTPKDVITFLAKLLDDGIIFEMAP